MCVKEQQVSVMHTVLVTLLDMFWAVSIGNLWLYCDK